MSARRSLDAVANVVDRAVEVLAQRPSALVTDIDGTLSKIVPNPQDAIVEVTVKENLRRLLPLLDAVAVITGREASVARRLVGVEGLTYVASYALDVANSSPAASPEVVAARHHRFHRQRNSIHHGHDEIPLVLEVPVDRSARDVRRLRDVLQRCTRDAKLAENAFCGVEDAAARLFGFVLGASYHAVPLCAMRNGRSASAPFTYIHDCM